MGAPIQISVYDDKLIVWNEGSLPDDMTVEYLKKAGLPESDIEINSDGISVTIFKNIYSEKQLKDKGLSERQIKAVLYVKENGKITNKKYQNLNSFSRETSSRDLKSLVELGILKAIGSKGAGSFFVLI